jgi:orotidine-5'-phosphate decarboxylase
VLARDAWLVVPGLRRRGDPRGDQVRVATVADAVAGGATHLVVGRPIIQAADPAAVFRELVEEARCAVS